jgi:MYXO-CTERM domain-containing protein
MGVTVPLFPEVTMRHRLPTLRTSLTAVALALAGLSAQAKLVTVTVDFEDVLTANDSGIYVEAGVGDFYNGGKSGAVGSATGPDFDTTFDSRSVAARSKGQGSGTASFARSATGPGADIGVGALVLIGQALRISFLTPVVGDISLTYSSTIGGSLELFGPSDTEPGGVISVGGRTLQPNEDIASEVYDSWARVTVGLSDAATSLIIRGVAGDMLVDNITFTREIATPPNGAPEPSSLALAAMALGGLVVGARRRKTT